MRRPESTRRRSIEKLSELLNGQYLQRNSPIPLYHQLKEILLKFVSDNTQGTYLPAEQEIASHFGISRPTVRQALKELEIDGHIRREKGRGTYIGKEDVDVRRTYQATFKEKIYVPISMHSRKVKLENKRIGISLFTHRSRYFNILRDNIDKVLSDYGVTELLSDANDNAETQIAQIEDLIARKVDLIIIDPVSPPSALNAVLEKNGISRDSVFITSILKHRTPGNRVPWKDEIAACKPYLKEQLQLIRPRIVILMGMVAWKEAGTIEKKE